MARGWHHFARRCGQPLLLRQKPVHCERNGFCVVVVTQKKRNGLSPSPRSPHGTSVALVRLARSIVRCTMGLFRGLFCGFRGQCSATEHKDQC